MTVSLTALLVEAREIWGADRLSLLQVANRLGVVAGDVQRLARDVDEGRPVDLAEVGKELGNLILSGVRWCDDLGINPDWAVDAARVAQRRYVAMIKEAS